MLYGLDPRSPLKPGVDQRERITPAQLDATRKAIHSNVREQIKRSQELQKLYYDRHRRPRDLYIGQLVCIKVHAAPPYICRKLYQKWDGPLVIIDFIGDRLNPKAVVVLDYHNKIKKSVSIEDVKPFIDSYQPKSNSVDKNNRQTYSL